MSNIIDENNEVRKNNLNNNIFLNIVNLNNLDFNSNILSNDFLVGSNCRNGNNITTQDLSNYRFNQQFRNYHDTKVYDYDFMFGGINTRNNYSCNN